MQKPLMTALIDTYNYGRFIDEAIASVLAQDIPQDELEILIVDDGSTDDTAQRVKKYGSRIQFFTKTNGGQGSAFNFGIERAQGDIVVLLDADDYWLPGKLQRVRDEFEKNPEAGMVYHRLLELDMRTGERRDAHFTAISGFVPSDLKKVLLFNALTTTGLAFRRTVVQRVLPVPEGLRIQADAYIATLTTFLAPIVVIDEPLAVYRIHGENLYFQSAEGVSADRMRRRIATRRILAEQLRAWFVSHGYNTSRPEIRATLQRWILMSEDDEFKLSPPNRLKLFWHLLRSYRQNGPLMTRRIRMVNYFNALGALVVGYERFPLLDQYRERATRWLKNTLMPSSRDKQALPASDGVPTNETHRK